MRPTPNLDMVIFTLLQNQPEDEPLTLEMVSDGLPKVGKNNLGFSASILSDLGTELNDLVAAHGAEFDAKAIYDRSAPDLTLWLQTDKDSALKATHVINPIDASFTQRLYSIELPAGNFSVAYGVYANNEQDALDELADFEIRRQKSNPDIVLFKADVSHLTDDEIEKMENEGEIARIGNDGQLFDVSTISIKKVELIALNSDVDISEHLQEKKKLFKDVSKSPSPGF